MIVREKINAVLLLNAQIRKAKAAAVRFDDPNDAEALHDFRVAVRRLRVLISAFADQLGDAGRKSVRKRIRSFTTETNRLRDCQVLAGILSETLRDSNSRPEMSLLHRRFADEYQKGKAALTRTLVPRFNIEADQIQRLLNALPRRTQPFLPLVAIAIKKHARHLNRGLGRITSPGDSYHIHSTRIAAKKIRYLLEPFAGGIKHAPKMINKLKQLQDLLGELHDVQVLRRNLKKRDFGLSARENVLFKRFQREMGMHGRFSIPCPRSP